MLRLDSDTILQYTSVLHHLDTAYSLPETVDNLHESADSLHKSADSLPNSREPQVYTGMVLPDMGLRPLGSEKLHHGLFADDYQVLETAVREQQVVD
ncbi:hypothetical protein ACFX11_038180 [Malus domestica]